MSAKLEKPMRRLSAVAVAAMLCCGVAAAISYEEEIPAFRNGVDRYRIHVAANGEWEGDKFVVSVTNRQNFFMSYSRFPGMKPFRGADEIVLKTEAGDLGPTKAELVLSEFPGGTHRKFLAPLVPDVRFKTKLDPTKFYQLHILGIHRAKWDGKPWKIGFTSLRGTFITPKADALRVEAETGNPLHIVREGKDERPVLVIRNVSQDRIVAHGTLKMKGFSGDAIDLPVNGALDGGKTMTFPIVGAAKKGAWKIVGELKADDGSVAKVDTRFAVMDCHALTPKTPRGMFRLGINWHIARFSPADLKLTAAAMVACGAKLARGDMASMASIQSAGPDSWNFDRVDKLVDTLDEHGIAMDAIIYSVPKWAAKPEYRTNANWKVWAHGGMVPGAFEKFCEGLAARYGTRIDYYEIGNEWDLGFHGTFDEAVDIQREAYIGLKRGCPDVCVIPNGWTSPGDTPGIVKRGRAGLHEYFLRKARNYFDVHPIHCHGPFVPYARSIKDGFFPLRARTGVEDKPWYSNETALTSVWSERNAALTVWKKILWAWAHGSVDYIWYNLKGTGWDPKDAEQGYGLITADFRPRGSYVAFAALATVVGGATFKSRVIDDGGTFCFEFAKGDSIVLTAWDEAGTGREIPVQTDAARAWLVDLMGNRTAVPLADGKAVFKFAAEPCAIVLEKAMFAKTGETVLRTPSAVGPGAIVIPADKPGRKPDFVFDKSEQVHDFFEANPAEIKRLWKGPKDNSGKVWLAKDACGLRIRVEVEDDVHCQPYSGAEQYLGDDIQVLLATPGQRGQWEFGFAHRDDGSPDVHCWLAPEGFNADEAAAWVELTTSRTGTVTRYDVLVPYAESEDYTEKTLTDGIRFNLMVNDNDGDGRDATIEIVPNTFHSKDIQLAPVIRFAP